MVNIKKLNVKNVKFKGEENIENDTSVIKKYIFIYPRNKYF